MKKTTLVLAAFAAIAATQVSAAPASSPVTMPETSGLGVALPVTPLCSVEGRRKDLINYLEQTLPQHCKYLRAAGKDGEPSPVTARCDAARQENAKDWQRSMALTCKGSE